jgi:outer membrane protein OmpA-like peptidoglycan-associated protein
MGSLGIAIDGGRFIRIDSSISGIPRNIRLQTLKPGQKTARLVFCVFRKSGPKERMSVLLDGLPSNSQQVVELKLQAERRSFALWAVTVRRPDGSAEEYRIRTGIGLWPLLVLLPLLLAAVWGVYGMISREPHTPGKGIPTAGKTAEKQKPVPQAAPETVSTEAVEPVAVNGDSPGGEMDKSVDLPNPGTGDSSPVPAPVFPVQSVVYFEPESAVLLPEARRLLDGLSTTMPADLRLEISGHCAFYGTEKGRRELSAERAEAVASYLKSRIPPTVELTRVAYGGDRPVSRNLDTQDLNRRVELTVVDE